MLNMKPPTDNIYKFMAITGLLLIILGITYPYKELNKNIAEIYKLNSQANLILLDKKELFYSKQLSEQEYNAKLRQYNEKLIKLNEDQGIFNAHKNQTGLSIIIGLCGVVIGFLLALLGFILWYKKLQKYLDVIIKTKSERIM